MKSKLKGVAVFLGILIFVAFCWWILTQERNSPLVFKKMGASPSAAPGAVNENEPTVTLKKSFSIPTPTGAQAPIEEKIDNLGKEIDALLNDLDLEEEPLLDFNF